MVGINVDDIRAMYEHTIVMRGNKPVYISRVNEEGVVRYTDLLTQEREVEKFSLKTFTPPAARRLGMINIGGSVAYASRVPVRRYKVGISSENLSVKALEVEYPEGRDRTLIRIKELECPEIGKAMLNKYPTLEKCLKIVEEFGGAMAFDKQFAVDRRRHVYYKTNRVGVVPEGVTQVEGIVFNKGHEQLGILLNGNHEKSIRTSAC